MARLAAFLVNQLSHPVADKTGLREKYDFILEYRPESTGRPISPVVTASVQSGDATEPGTDIGTALEEQLGLRLVKGKASLPFIVVDSLEKLPNGN